MNFVWCIPTNSVVNYAELIYVWRGITYLLVLRTLLTSNTHKHINRLTEPVTKCQGLTSHTHEWTISATYDVNKKCLTSICLCIYLFIYLLFYFIIYYINSCRITLVGLNMQSSPNQSVDNTKSICRPKQCSFSVD